MEVFSDIKSNFYRALEEIINTTYKNGEISQKEVQEILKKYNCNFPSVEKKILNRYEDEDKNLNILKKDDSDRKYILNLNSPIKPYILDIELLWLKFIINSRYINLFLDDKTIEKVKKIKVKNSILLDSETIKFKNFSKVMTKDEIIRMRENFKTIVDAILDKRIISYEYIKRDGNKIQNVGIPVKVQYSIKDDLFYVIIYSISQDKFAKCIISNISSLRVEDESKFVKPSTDEILQRYSDFLKSCEAKEPIVLEVENERNSLERAFLLFSPFKKSARFINEKGKHQISLYYYTFEEMEIISRILYLGKHVVVVSPQRIRDEIISRIKKALLMYGEKI